MAITLKMGVWLVILKFFKQHFHIMCRVEPQRQMDIEVCLIIQFQYHKWPPLCSFTNYLNHLSFQTRCQIVLRLLGEELMQHEDS